MATIRGMNYETIAFARLPEVSLVVFPQRDFVKLMPFDSRLGLNRSSAVEAFQQSIFRKPNATLGRRSRSEYTLVRGPVFQTSNCVPLAIFEV